MGNGKQTKTTTLLEVKESLDSVHGKLETISQVLSALVHNKIVQMPAGVEPKRRPKLTDEEKQRRKDELMKGVPYTAEALKELSQPNLKLLASALKLASTFGMSKKNTEALILKGQKKTAQKPKK